MPLNTLPRKQLAAWSVYASLAASLLQILFLFAPPQTAALAGVVASPAWWGPAATMALLLYARKAERPTSVRWVLHLALLAALLCLRWAGTKALLSLAPPPDLLRPWLDLGTLAVVACCWWRSRPIP